MWRPLFERQQRDKDHHLESEKLISVSSQQMYFLIRGRFQMPGSPAAPDPGPIRRGCPPQQGAVPTAVQDSVLTYSIYVHRDDYDRAFAATPVRHLPGNGV